MPDIILVSDTENGRLVKRLTSDLSYVSQFGSSGAGDDQFSQAQGIATDGIHIYVADTYNHRIVKRLSEDYSFVSKMGSEGTGNDNFSAPVDIVVSGDYLYVMDSNNRRIVKRAKADLSYVSEVSTNWEGYSPNPYYGTTDGTYLYTTEFNPNRITKRLLSDLSVISRGGDTYFTGYGTGVVFVSPNLYVAVSNDQIATFLASDLSFISAFGSYGSGNDQFISPYAITSDGTNLYVADKHKVTKRLVSDLSYVSRIGSVGSGDDEFSYPQGICYVSSGGDPEPPPPVTRSFGSVVG